MKFNIFKWWEPLVKPFIYVFVLLITAGLITGYCFVSDASGKLAFIISILYAFALFLITIPLAKIDGYTAEKLYEREEFYLVLKRLREVTNSTIQKADANDIENCRNHVLNFQIFTGREAHMLEEKLQGKKVPVYVREKGFSYTTKMQDLETKFLKAYDSEANKKELFKCAEKLCKCYKKSCKNLEKNYNRISRVYGGALFDLIERDSAASDTEYSLSDIGSKVDEICSDISSLKNEIDELASSFNDNQRELTGDHNAIVEKLMDIEVDLLDIKYDADANP